MTLQTLVAQREWYLYIV